MYKLNLTLGINAIKRFADYSDKVYKYDMLEQHRVNINSELLLEYAANSGEYADVVCGFLEKVNNIEGLTNYVEIIDDKMGFEEKLVSIAEQDPQGDKVLIAGADEFEEVETSNIKLIDETRLLDRNDMNPFRIFSKPVKMMDTDFGTVQALKDWLRKMFQGENDITIVDPYLLQTTPRFKLRYFQKALDFLPLHTNVTIYSEAAKSCINDVNHYINRSNCKDWNITARLYDSTFRNHDRIIRGADFEVDINAGCDILTQLDPIISNRSKVSADVGWQLDLPQVGEYVECKNF